MQKAIYAAITALGFVATACGRPAILLDSQEDSDSSAYVMRALSRAAGSDGMAPWYRNLGELLPNTRYAEPGGHPQAATTRVFVGRVVEVVAGKGFWVPSGDAPGGTMIDFVDSRAMWKTVHLRTEVEQGLDRVSTAGETIWVGLATDPSADPQKLAEGFSELGSLVFFLYEESPVFDYDKRLAAIAEDGTMVATIAADGRLGLPALEDPRRGPMLNGYETLDDLIDQADGPQRVIELRRDGEFLVRSD